MYICLYAEGFNVNEYLAWTEIFVLEQYFPRGICIMRMHRLQSCPHNLYLRRENELITSSRAHITNGQQTSFAYLDFSRMKKYCSSKQACILKDFEEFILGACTIETMRKNFGGSCH